MADTSQQEGVTRTGEAQAWSSIEFPLGSCRRGARRRDEASMRCDGQTGTLDGVCAPQPRPTPIQYPTQWPNQVARSRRRPSQRIEVGPGCMRRAWRAPIDVPVVERSEDGDNGRANGVRRLPSRRRGGRLGSGACHLIHWRQLVLAKMKPSLCCPAAASETQSRWMEMQAITALMTIVRP